jgi:hypothetical protein
MVERSDKPASAQTPLKLAATPAPKSTIDGVLMTLSTHCFDKLGTPTAEPAAR